MNLEEIQKQFDLYSNMYRALSGVAAGLPLHPKLLDKVAHYLDTGFLWVKEGLQAANAAELAAQSAQAAQSAASVEKVKGVEDASAVPSLVSSQEASPAVGA